jgi:hypothetical protein
MTHYFGGRPKIGVASKPAPSAVAWVWSSHVSVGAMVLISQKIVLLPLGKCLNSFENRGTLMAMRHHQLVISEPTWS